MFQFKWSEYAYTKLGNHETLRNPSTVRRIAFTSLLFILVFYLVISVLQTSHDLVTDINEGPLKEDEIEFTLENCGCRRRLQFNANPEDLSFNQTTCGKDAFMRGPHQKIVGFSFYGDINSDYSKKKGYFEGIIGNLELMPKYYPGWVMRLYYDLDAKDPVFQDLCQLACKHKNLDICDAKHLPGTPFIDASRVFAMNWRFFPTLDPQVDFYVSRDLDSRFSDREQSAVQEWLDSKYDFHFMRDHPHHGTKILGSGWGSKLVRVQTRMNWQKAWNSGFTDKLVWAKRNSYGPDQAFLSRYVWPWAKKTSISHDSYTCKNYPRTKGFPTQRKNEPNNFVAAVVAENHTLWKTCPPACRPKSHPDWEHC